MYWKNKKGINPNFNGALPQTPGFNALRTKAWLKKGQRNAHTAPMLRSPATALRLLPSRALSSELVETRYQGIEKMQENDILETMIRC